MTFYFNLYWAANTIRLNFVSTSDYDNCRYGLKLEVQRVKFSTNRIRLPVPHKSNLQRVELGRRRWHAPGSISVTGQARWLLSVIEKESFDSWSNVRPSSPGREGGFAARLHTGRYGNPVPGSVASGSHLFNSNDSTFFWFLAACCKCRQPVERSRNMTGFRLPESFWSWKNSIIMDKRMFGAIFTISKNRDSAGASCDRGLSASQILLSYRTAAWRKPLHAYPLNSGTELPFSILSISLLLRFSLSWILHFHGVKNCRLKLVQKRCRYRSQFFSILLCAHYIRDRCAVPLVLLVLPCSRAAVFSTTLRTVSQNGQGQGSWFDT